jgi:RNA polymerase sigma-70 factor (ECF subfamily)
MVEDWSEQPWSHRTALHPFDISFLLRRVRARDHDAPMALYDYYSVLVYSMARQITKDDRLAQRTLSETFLRLWSASSTYDPAQGRFETWLLRLARGIASGLARPGTPPWLGYIQGDASPEPHEVHHALMAGRRSAVRRAIEAMPAKQRAVLMLAYYERWSVEQMAEYLSVPAEIVRALLRRGLRDLGQALG